MSSALQLLIRDAFANQASDVFLIEGEPPRVRIEGEVSLLHPGPVPREAIAEFWKSCGVDPVEKLDADASWQLPGGGRLRINLYHTLGRLAAALRPIRSDILPMAELGLPAPLLESWMTRRFGLVLITGPTGAGKSTTVASCLEWINRNLSRHIVTLEDPIEFLFSSDRALFSQREIRQDSSSFASGLRSALRQSPDVIFIGEVRDPETALTALRAAETGHLVISTLHSSSVVETLERLSHFVDAGGPGALTLLSGQLVGILSQQLLPRVGGGLFPALEYMQNEAAVRQWIRESRLTELQDYLHRSAGESNCALLDYLVAGVRQGYLTPDVARSAAPRPQDFDRAMRGITS